MSTEHQNLKRNIKLLYVINFFDSSFFAMPIYILFGTQYLGLSYFKAGSFLIVNLLVSIIFDFLGGIFSDKFGRKRAFIYGMSLQLVSFLPFLITKSYWALLAASVVNGVGIALSSNSIDAIIYEQSIDNGAKKTYQHANANVSVISYFGRIYASLVGGFVYIINPRLPYGLLSLAIFFALVAGACIKTNKNIDTTKRSHYLVVMRTALKAYKHNLAMLKFVIIGGLFALWSDMLFSYYQPYFIQQNVPSSVLGVLFAAIAVFSALGSYYMRKLPDKISASAIQSIELIGVVTTSLLLIILKLPVSFVAPLIMAIISGFMYPNMRLYINNHTKNHIRASVLSFATTLFSAGTVVGFLLSFYMADKMSASPILIIITVGAILTLLANIFIKVPDARTKAL